MISGARILLLILLTTALSDAFAQDRSGRNYSVPKFRGSKAKILCPVFDRGRYPYHGLGVKLGDPFALTYKYYASKSFALAVDLGRTASGLYRDYYESRFETYRQQAGERPNVVYIGHKVESDWVLEGRLLYHADVSRTVEGLQAYAGAGWAWKRTALVYDYQYQQVGSDADPFGSLTSRGFAIGPQFVVGLEYSYFSIPVSAFLETEYFVDVREDPGARRVEGGIGLRYIF